MNKYIEYVLDFWFGDIRDGLIVENRNDFWFMPNSQIDNTIREEFEELVVKAGKGKLIHWEQSAKGTLALIILLDQFTRNIYRGKREAFQFDAEALRICKAGIQRGHDRELEVIEKCFYYLPLEHSENLEEQDKCVKLFEDLLVTVDSNKVSIVKNSLDYAVLHRNIIEKFGRFPHRNEVLNRKSTNEELVFLSKQGNKFGQ
ncbi:MAG TPA: DUF924 family protein [Thermodesulfobacteriota bacterium]|nr:DUF924 family protein [Thermodesulfobacteriota bacterium]